MAEELVSVVISTYERNELLLSRSLASVRMQSHQNMEINIVSDGMRGESLEELVFNLQALKDPRIKHWKASRQTYPDDPGQKWMVLGLNARNTGLNQALGDWVAPLDDDDEWTSDHIEVLLQAVTESGADFAYGVSEYHWPDGHQQRAGRWPPGYGAFCDGAQLYRNGMGYRYDPACIERGLPEDGDMWERMRAGGVKFEFVERVVHHYYPNPR